MKKIFFFFAVFSIYLYAKCTPYPLGLETSTGNDIISSKNSLVWKLSKSRWEPSTLLDKVDLDNLKCDTDSYVLINNNDISYLKKPFDGDIYYIKRGWNYIASHKDGIDVAKTFGDTNDIEFVYVYEPRTQVWAGYSPQKYIREKMYNTRILALEKIEPGLGFYVYSKRSVSVKIKSVNIANSCMSYMKDDSYKVLIDSGLDKGFVDDTNRSISLRSRYFSHHRRGVYDDTRVMLIYPKLKIKNKAKLKYGPALPTTMLKFSKEYENKTFYMYDYKDEKCYKGIFPSIKMPPIGVLKEI